MSDDEPEPQKDRARAFKQRPTGREIWAYWRAGTWKGFKRIFHTLLGNILGLVGVGLVLAVILWPVMGLLLYGEPTPLIPRGDPARNTALTVVLTVVAGVGGAIALAISYRKQKQAEATNFLERLGTAAGQLGASSAAVQFAGIHALAALADEALVPSQQQQCLDVLCSYMRLPYDESAHRTTLTGVVTKRTWLSSTGSYDVTRTYEHRPSEIRVRQTIMQVITDHFRSSAASSWSHLRLDLSECVIPFADFTSLKLDAAIFQSARFTEGVDFSGSSFGSEPNFAGARFSRAADFEGTTFHAGAKFIRVTAAENIGFSRVEFAGSTDFTGATFCKQSTFDSALFGVQAWFQGTRFHGEARFDRVRFRSHASFGTHLPTHPPSESVAPGEIPYRLVMRTGAKYLRDFTRNDRGPAVFLGRVSFDRSKFEGPADFTGVDFVAGKSFVDVRFSVAPEGLALEPDLPAPRD